jgi:hypothetical protein
MLGGLHTGGLRGFVQLTEQDEGHFQTHQWSAIPAWVMGLELLE